jgi:hypothetical protein
VEDTDYLLIGFANGKILQLCVDLKAIISRASKPSINDYIRKAILEKECSTEAGLNVHTGPIWGAQTSYIGTVHTKMQRVLTPNGPAVISCSNKPVVFYINQRSIEMQYLSCG